MIFQKKKTVSILIQDYVIRLAMTDKQTSGSIEIIEKVIPSGLIEEGQITDESGFYDFFKKIVEEWGIKKHKVRFFVPDSSVLMKPVSVPAGLKGTAISEHFMMETGQSIHFPFENPLIDVIRLDSQSRSEPDEVPGILFASPEEDVQTFTNVFEDVKLIPEAAEVKALALHRLLFSMNALDTSRTYLISDWSVNGLNITIFSNGIIDFMRYQPIETMLGNWEIEQDGKQVHIRLPGDSFLYEQQLEDRITELERLMNFYRFSLHKGEKSVDELIISGDNPFLEWIMEKVNERYEIPVQMINHQRLLPHFQGMEAKHAALLGLFLKGATR
ncbi:type IV pilus biogenesis protein PilM [Jeotgalibacillus aurantiacus]|uniref:type IV pilus biogenesis protein PilM n=1 Tax=Jeotgalibacillus aurantiacus TaxID=2763266 RepID=UPI001D0B2836|nr:pilus assembly protein PilM [Jeotgalibacillus aurantiacus]